MTSELEFDKSEPHKMKWQKKNVKTPTNLHIKSLYYDYTFHIRITLMVLAGFLAFSSFKSVTLATFDNTLMGIICTVVLIFTLCQILLHIFHVIRDVPVPTISTIIQLIIHIIEFFLTISLSVSFFIKYRCYSLETTTKSVVCLYISFIHIFFIVHNFFTIKKTKTNHSPQ